MSEPRNKKIKLNKTLIIGCFIVIIVMLFIRDTYIITPGYFRCDWDVTLPENMTKAYEKRNIGWMGDGYIYNVCTVDKSFDFSQISCEEDKYLEEDIEEICNILKVPKEYRPRFNERYHIVRKYEENRILYLVYELKHKRVIILESVS